MTDDSSMQQAYEFAAGAGEAIAEATEVGGPVGLAVGAAAAVGVGAGTLIDHATGASGYIADGLSSLVGDEESYKASQAFDNGDYLGVAEHMATGAAHTVEHAVEHAASSVVDGAEHLASEAWNGLTDLL